MCNVNSVACSARPIEKFHSALRSVLACFGSFFCFLRPTILLFCFTLLALIDLVYSHREKKVLDKPVPVHAQFQTADKVGEHRGAFSN